MLDSYQLKLCDIQGRLFQSFASTSYDEESLIKAYMKGFLGQCIDSSYNRYQWAGEEYLLEELIDASKEDLLPKKQNYNKEALYWIGYIYRYWHFLKEEDSKTIYKIAPFKRMNTNYLLFHTMDNELAIEELIELQKQKQKRANDQAK